MSSELENSDTRPEAGLRAALSPLAPSVAAAELVLAVAHEIGNQIGAIRLEAHLLDDDLGPRELAAASVGIDDLAGRAGVLLGLLRPILSSPEVGEPGDARFDPDRLVDAVGRMLEEQGTRGVRLEVDPSAATGPLPGEHELIRQLVFALGAAGLEAARPRGRARIAARAEGEDFMCLEIADDGDEEALGEGEALRGRPLLCAIARFLLAQRGGSLVARRDGDWTRIALRLPRAR